MDYNFLSKKSIYRCFAVLFLMAIAITSFSGCTNKDTASLQNEILSVFDDEYVSRVKSGHFEMTPNIPIGDAFARFFGDPEWKSFESTDGQRVVEFKGKCTWQDKPAICRMQFIIKGDNSFETGAVSINDNNLTVLETSLIMAKILRDSASDSPVDSATINDVSNSDMPRSNSKSNDDKGLSSTPTTSNGGNITASRPASNAMLGNVKLGDSVEEAERILGTPTKKTVKGGNKLSYEYPLMDIDYDYGAVICMACDDASVSTPKGIHAGSSLQEVLNTYGSDYMLSSYDDLDLYEYKFRDDNQRQCLLRFAVKQGTGNVKYISVRYVN